MAHPLVIHFLNTLSVFVDEIEANYIYNNAIYLVSK